MTLHELIELLQEIEEEIRDDPFVGVFVVRGGVFGVTEVVGVRGERNAHTGESRVVFIADGNSD